jgi:hypothetical protein
VFLLHFSFALYAQTTLNNRGKLQNLSGYSIYYERVYFHRTLIASVANVTVR